MGGGTGERGLGCGRYGREEAVLLRLWRVARWRGRGREKERRLVGRGGVEVLVGIGVGSGRVVGGEVEEEDCGGGGDAGGMLVLIRSLGRVGGGSVGVLLCSWGCVVSWLSRGAGGFRSIMGSSANRTLRLRRVCALVLCCSLAMV